MKRRGERGMALIGVIVLSALLMSLALTLAVSVNSDTQMRGALGRSTTGFYAAESGLNTGMGEYRNIFLNYNVPNGPDFAPRSFTIADRTVDYQMTPRPGNPQEIVIPSGELFAGLNAQQYRYTVNSSATNINDDVEARVGAEFLVGYIPLFQFVAFYKNDLEILPGPTMNLMGRVHTNGNLFLNAVNQLNVIDNPAVGVFTVQVSAGGDIYRGRKNLNTCTGSVSVDMLADNVAPFGNLDPRNLPCNGGATRLVPTAETRGLAGFDDLQCGQHRRPRTGHHREGRRRLLAEGRPAHRPEARCRRSAHRRRLACPAALGRGSGRDRHPRRGTDGAVARFHERSGVERGE